MQYKASWKREGVRSLRGADSVPLILGSYALQVKSKVYIERMTDWLDSQVERFSLAIVLRNKTSSDVSYSCRSNLNYMDSTSSCLTFYQVRSGISGNLKDDS